MQTTLPPASARRHILSVVTSLLLASMAMGAHAGLQSSSAANLARYRNKNRLLFVFAPSPNDRRFQDQKTALAGKEGGLSERDLIHIDAFERGPSKRGDAAISSVEASSWRRQFHVAHGQFQVVVIGKDGRVAYRVQRPVTASQLFSLVDGMPMRREEMNGARQNGIKDATPQSRIAVKQPTPPRPDKQWTPDQVVKFQMEALQHNDVPKPDTGIATTFAFASPQNRLATGPLEHFTQIVKAPAYLPMLNCKKITYEPIVIDGDNAQQRVHVVGADGSRITYIFLLSRQKEGPYADCWMNDGCVRDNSEAESHRFDA